MSTLRKNRNVPFAEPAANWMKPSVDAAARTHPVSVKSVLYRSGSGLLSLAAVLSAGVIVPASAQKPTVPGVAPEQGFTIATKVNTPMVLKTEPYATCDLHPSGDSDQAHTLKVYANSEGYVKVHVTLKEESRDEHMQLDCSTVDAVTIHPLHLQAGSTPTADMPAPQASVPAPQGAQVRAALTDEGARLLTDEDLLSRGYPPRPDATQSPDAYASWLRSVSRPITLLPPHGVSFSRPARAQQSLAGGTETGQNWSGYEARSKPGSYMEVSGEWAVPPVNRGDPGSETYSYLWVGMDGDAADGGPTDLVQAGTMQNYLDAGGSSYAIYHAWTEYIPYAAATGPAVVSPLPVNPGDVVLVNVWIGDSDGTPRPNGTYVWFFLQNNTEDAAVEDATPLGGAYFTGSEAEWIMERPGYALSAFGAALIQDARALTAAGVWKGSSTIASTELLMQDGSTSLVRVASLSPNKVQFEWLNFR